MKKLLLLIVFLVVLNSVNAIVIVPPAVYVATLSILSVLFNMFVGLFAWIAVQGIATKKFFGKPFHSIAGFVVSSMGKLFFAVLLVAGFSVLFNPIELMEALFVSVVAGGVFFFCLFLSRFRQLRDSRKKLRITGRIALFSVIVLVIGFVSITFSIQLVHVSSGKKAPVTEAPLSFPEKPTELPYQDKIRKEATPGKIPEGGITVEELWLVPVNGKKCILSANGSELFFTLEKNCIEKSESGLNRVFCPIKIEPRQFSQKGVIELKATGSCSGEMIVRVKENQFEVMEK